MDAIEDTCPLEDRVAERLGFQGLNHSAARQALWLDRKVRRKPALVTPLPSFERGRYRANARSFPGERLRSG